MRLRRCDRNFRNKKEYLGQGGTMIVTHKLQLFTEEEVVKYQEITDRICRLIKVADEDLIKLLEKDTGEYDEYLESWK
jgi:hypothetical protein